MTLSKGKASKPPAAKKSLNPYTGAPVLAGPGGELLDDWIDVAEAQRRSKEIDEKILESKKALEKKRRTAQILLLGQAESGKSSVLKNFQLTFAPRHFERERLVWKTIIQLNLISSIKLLLDILQNEWESANDTSPSQPDRNLRRIRLGLSPLFFIESNLMKVISPNSRDSHDVCVRSGGDWKSMIMSLRKNNDTEGSRHSYQALGDLDPTDVLAASKDDIVVLWEDPSVQEVLKRHHIRMDNLPGFFLNDIDRIARVDYVPSNADIMRARIRTMGVEEHYFVIEKGYDIGAEVYITDVGGSRTQRAKWTSYFEDVQTIVFLAPLVFHQHLEEEPRVNRLEDSIHLWRDICSNRLLAKALIILFFNKKDILGAMLNAGVQVKTFVPSYGDGPNEIRAVTDYFRRKFKRVHTQFSPTPRPFMFHETSAIDIESMEALLMGGTIRDTILRMNLREGKIIL